MKTVPLLQNQPPFFLDLFHLRDVAKKEAGRGITSTLSLDRWLPQCTKEESL